MQSIQLGQADQRIDLHIIVITFNSANLIWQCIEAIRNSKLNVSYRITLFDNGSSDSLAYSTNQDAFSDLDIILNKNNLGFGRANNAAYKRYNADYTLLLNPDAIVDPKAIENAIHIVANDASIAVVGGCLTDLNGLNQPSARFSPTPWSIFLRKIGLWKRLYPNRDDLSWPRLANTDCDWVPGCFYLIRKSALTKLSLFDPRFFLYYEEVDHCKRVREAGMRVVCSPDVRVRHIGGASAETVEQIDKKGRQISALLIESELLFMRKHFGFLGLSMHVVLGWCALVLICLKKLLRWRSDVMVEIHYQALLIKILAATQLGSRPIH
jgi:N-acetylglucosaminyl-diphospho-decaprenol L-rhamnosyltransferase